MFAQGGAIKFSVCDGKTRIPTADRDAVQVSITGDRLANPSRPSSSNEWQKIMDNDHRCCWETAHWHGF